VRLQGHQIAECLHEQDQSRSPFHLGAGIGLDEQSLHDMAQLPQQSAPARKYRPEHPGYGEDVLAVRNRGENVRLDPIAVGEHALLVAARAEVTRLT